MKLIFLYGPPAVGKFTIGTSLSKRLGIPLIDNHSIANPIVRLFPWGDPDQQRLTREFRLELFRTASRRGKSLITTFGGGGMLYDDFIQETVKAVEENGGKVIFVQLTAPREVLFARVANESRKEKQTIASEQTLAQFFEEKPDVFSRALVPDHLEIDTSSQTIEELTTRIAEYVEQI